MSNLAPLCRNYLLEEYVQKRRSTYSIARELGVYANKVRRALMEYGIQLRDKREAQLAALEGGRSSHPTEGRKRSDEERRRISHGMLRKDN